MDIDWELKKNQVQPKKYENLLFSLIVNVAEPKCNLIKLKVELNYSVKSFTDCCSKQRTNRKGLSDKRNSVGNSYIFKSKFFTNVVNKWEYFKKAVITKIYYVVAWVNQYLKFNKMIKHWLKI